MRFDDKLKLAVLGLAAVAALLSACSKKEPADKSAPQRQQPGGSVPWAAKYVCPMHPEGRVIVRVQGLAEFASTA